MSSNEELAHAALTAEEAAFRAAEAQDRLAEEKVQSVLRRIFRRTEEGGTALCVEPCSKDNAVHVQWRRQVLALRRPQRVRRFAYGLMLGVVGFVSLLAWGLA